MSIFSRLLKRGAEEAGPASPEAPDADAAKKPAPPPRDAAPRAAVPAEAPPEPPPPAKTAVARPEPPPASAKLAALGVTRLYEAPGKPRAVAPTASPGAAPARATPARVATAAASPTKVPPRPGSRDAARLSGAAATTAGKGAAREGDGTPAEALSAPGSLDQAFEKLVSQAAPATAPASAAASSASDREAVMATFEELAIGHTAQVRSLMLEVRWGEPQTSWFEQARPALRSLRAMAGQIEHDALTSALDGFDTALGRVLGPGAAPVIEPAARAALLAAYAPLAAAMPRAFELDGERDRREPIVVRALLGQVQGLDPLMIGRMTAAGLGRLETLFQAKADEIAVVADIADDVAAAVAARVQAFRRETPAPLAAPDPAATARELAALYEALEADHHAFEDAARGWSQADRDAKKRQRRRRELSFLQIMIALARLGEVDLALHLEKLPFARRIEELQRRVNRALPPSPPAPSLEAGGRVSPPEYDEIEAKQIESGAHAAP